jgi:hypothetical protein
VLNERSFEEIAELYVDKSKRIAENLKRKIHQISENLYEKPS